MRYIQDLFKGEIHTKCEIYTKSSDLGLLLNVTNLHKAWEWEEGGWMDPHTTKPTFLQWKYPAKITVDILFRGHGGKGAVYPSVVFPPLAGVNPPPWPGHHAVRQCFWTLVKIFNTRHRTPNRCGFSNLWKVQNLFAKPTCSETMFRPC